MSTIGQEFEVQLGKRVDAAVNRGVPRICINNRGVRWGDIRIDEAIDALLTPSDLKDLRLVYGDVLVCEGGEIGRAAMWREQLPEAYFLNTLHRLRSRGRVDPRLVVSLLERWSSTGELAALVGKATLAHLTKENLVKAPIPVPPIADQHAIGNALEDTDYLINTLERLIAKKQAIKQGMMQQLLTGKTRLPGFTEPWRDVTLGGVVQFSKGMGLPKSSLTDSGRQPCVHYGELFTHYGPEIRSVTSRTNDTSLRVRSSVNDVLMPTSDVTPRGLAKASALMTDGVALGGDILVIRSDPQQVFGPFLAHAIRHDANQVLQLVRGSTVYHLYAADMRTYRFMLPSVDEQRGICEALRDAEDEIETLRHRLTKTKAIKQGMMQQLLTGRTRLPAEDPV